MAISTADDQPINVNLIPGNLSFPEVYISQYDNGKGRPILFNVFDGTDSFTIPDDVNVTLEATKPDGFGYSVDCSSSGNQVIAETYTNQLTAVHGLFYGQLVFTRENGARVGCIPIAFHVSRAGISDETIISDSEISAITTAVDDARAAALVARTAADETATAAERAKTAAESATASAEETAAKVENMRGEVADAKTAADEASTAATAASISAAQSATAVQTLDGQVAGLAGSVADLEGDVTEFKNDLIDNFENRTFSVSGYGELTIAGAGVKVNIAKAIKTGDVFYAVIKEYNGNYYKGAQLYGVANGSATVILSKVSSWAIGTYYKITATADYDSLYFWITNTTKEVCSAEAFIAAERVDKTRTICCLGDSFTAGTTVTSWWKHIDERKNYNMVGLGVAGSRMTVTYANNGTEYKSFIDRVADGALDSYSPDLIIVFGGLNDAVKLHNSQCRIGSISDEAEYDPAVTAGYSFIGRVKYLINLIKTKKPGVPILGVLMPDYSEGTSNYTWWYDYLEQIREGLRAVYEYYGIPYVDLKKVCQEMYIDDYNLAKYRANKLSNMHPSAAGYEAIGKVIYTKGIVDMFY